jgi:hypothetical protein
MRIRVFCSNGGKWGLGVDTRLVGDFLERSRDVRGGIQVEYCDPVMWVPRPPQRDDDGVVDCHIYLEVPSRMAIAWARYNVLVVNPEWFPKDAWNWTFAERGGIDLFVFKTPMAAALFPDVPAGRRLVIPWRSPMEQDFGRWETKEDRFLYVVGASANKAAVARSVVAAWRTDWPPLEIWCSEEIAESLRPLVRCETVEFQTEFRPGAEREARQRACKWHVVASAAEGFGFTMAEAAACGAPALWTDLDCYVWNWDLDITGRISCIEVAAADEPTMRQEKKMPESTDAIAMGVRSLLALTPTDVSRIQEKYRSRRSETLRAFRDGWTRVVQRAVRGAHASGLPTAPPRGTVPPKVAVVTLTRNRAEWWGNMVQNINGCAWPASRLEWIVMDDSDDGGAALAPKVAELSGKVPFVVRHLPVANRGASLGEKRNAAVAAATADCDVFVMMDDDDHYPPGSVATRVSWLAGRGAVYCSTIPMYDVRRYVSAMNVPPLGLSPAERVSEATLAFTRGFWEARGFPAVGVAEGEGFLVGRESETREVPPVGVIVSFIHKGNTTSRRIPDEQEANGCHYGFKDEYFTYLHSIGM